MNNSNDDTTPADRTARNQPKGEYDVGYCRPPAAHRFKHGNNANPKGRRKVARNRKLVIQEVLFEPVTVREGGEVKQIPAIEAVFKKTLAKALGGDGKAMLTIIGLAQKVGIVTPEEEQAVENLSERDQAIMADFRRRLEAAAPEQQAPNPEGDG